MNSLAALTVLLQRAETERDAAIGVLRQAEGLVAQAQAQAEQLTAYRQDFRVRWAERFRTAGTPELLHCRQSFGQRLDAAIAHQATEAQHLSNRVTRAREVLLAREQRVAAVRKLIERRQAELRRLADQRDQRATDEAAQRALAVGAQRAALQP
ncbi:MAG: flagellar export protein FliJ [Burkholderiales bacterium PBB5]|nr:MAG: flagellar export protein FliJ [Burkholderiales bacterium PBB5]